MDFVHIGLLSKINLAPFFGAAQIPDPFADCRTDISCHSFMI